MNLNDKNTLINLLIRVYAIEKVLVKSNIISAEDLNKEFEQISEQFMKDVLSELKYDGDVESFIASLKLEKSKNKN